MLIITRITKIKTIKTTAKAKTKMTTIININNTCDAITVRILFVTVKMLRLMC